MQFAWYMKSRQHPMNTYCECDDRTRSCPSSRRSYGTRSLHGMYGLAGTSCNLQNACSLMVLCIVHPRVVNISDGPYGLFRSAHYTCKFMLRGRSTWFDGLAHTLTLPYRPHAVQVACNPFAFVFDVVRTNVVEAFGSGLFFCKTLFGHFRNKLINVLIRYASTFVIF